LDRNFIYQKEIFNAGKKRHITSVWQSGGSVLRSPTTGEGKKFWFSASIPIGIGMVKIVTFAKPQNVSGNFTESRTDKQQIRKTTNLI